MLLTTCTTFGPVASVEDTVTLAVSDEPSALMEILVAVMPLSGSPLPLRKTTEVTPARFAPAIVRVVVVPRARVTGPTLLTTGPVVTDTPRLKTSSVSGNPMLTDTPFDITWPRA